jgi:hypothetical protein
VKQSVTTFLILACSLANAFSATPTDNRQWVPLDTGELYVKPGTALDFTPFAEPGPAGSKGRVIVNERGELAFASLPDRAVRFMSVAHVPPYALRHWSDRDVDDYADAVVRQGYNMVRFHIFDEFLGGSDMGPQLTKREPSRYQLPEQADELHYDQRALDRLLRLLAALKERGVYWNMDLMTSYIGFSNAERHYTRHMGGFNTKVQMFVNPNFRANWKAGVAKLLGTVNSYTGISLRDDPALALVSCLNEQDVLLRERDYGDELNPAWHAYLEAKYGTYEKVREAWGGVCGDLKLPETGKISDLPPIGKEALNDTPAGRDMAWCCGEMEVEMSRFFLDALRELGFPGLVSNWNMRVHIGTTRARSLFPVVTMNTYHAHPLYGERTVVDPSSALSGGGTSFKHVSTSRLLDRPFVNTEMGIVFWNPYRHEQGLLFGAGAALQGWSGLTGFCQQIVDSGDPLKCFNTGADPVIRAAELVEAFAFRRGDVATSPHAIEIPLSDEFIAAGHAMVGIDDELSRLWPLCRIGVTYGKPLSPIPKGLSVSPDKTSQIGGSLMFSTVEAATSVERMSAIVNELRRLNVLGPDNKSDPPAGILQSDTQPITIDTAAGGEMRVVTPRLEGAVLSKRGAIELDAVRIRRCSVPASVTVVALDGGKDLRSAGRLLLVFSTDARNTGMKFADARESEITDWGSLPVVVRAGRLSIGIARKEPGLQAVAYALKLNGERAGEVPVRLAGDRWELEIDTTRPGPAGPTPFYEIIEVPTPPATEDSSK